MRIVVTNRYMRPTFQTPHGGIHAETEAARAVRATTQAI